MELRKLYPEVNQYDNEPKDHQVSVQLVSGDVLSGVGEDCSYCCCSESCEYLNLEYQLVVFYYLALVEISELGKLHFVLLQ